VLKVLNNMARLDINLLQCMLVSPLHKRMDIVGPIIGYLPVLLDVSL
jgi:hypothetical protein